MGNWNITVRGVGSHHNPSNPKDANVMTADFVRALKAAGHMVVSASFTYGGEDELTSAAPVAHSESTKPESD